MIELEPTVRPVDLNSGSCVNTHSGACQLVHGEGDISAVVQTVSIVQTWCRASNTLYAWK